MIDKIKGYVGVVFFAGLSLHSIAAYSQNPLTENFPGPREDALLIYHAPSKAMLLVGGTPILQDSVQSDVWKWDGNTWSKIEANGPGARVFFQGGLHPQTSTFQLFAGAGLARSNSLTGDLWSFNGKKWSRIMNNEIGTHDHHKMVYADHLNAFVLYGGNVNHTFDTVTWLMQDGQFTALNIPGPGVRYQSGMVYDKHRKKVVLYGGGDHPDEHWEFDGKKWERIVTDVNPGIKLYHHMTYDENRNMVILHGGLINHYPQDPKNFVTPLTWTWNGVEWKKIAEEKIYSLAIGYHPIRKSVIAYGFDDGDATVSRSLALWELKNYQWTKISDYGKWDTNEFFKKHIARKPEDMQALIQYANYLRSVNQLAEAESVFKKVAKANPQKASKWFELIDVLIRENKLSEAEEYIVKIENSGQVKREMYVRVGGNLHRVKDYPLAAYYYEKALAMEKRADDFYNLACAYSLAENKDLAFGALDNAADLGYNTKQNYEDDADLESLRSDARWNALLKKLK